MSEDGGTCTWTFEQGIWTAESDCAPGFSCGEAPIKGGGIVLHITVNTPNGPVEKLAVNGADFLDHATNVYKSVGKPLPTELDTLLRNLPAAPPPPQVELPCVKSESPVPDPA